MKARVLPFMDQAAAVQLDEHVLLSGAAQNATNLTTMVGTFLCPSDGNVPCGTSDVERGRGAQIGYTSYPNNLGTTPTNNGGRYDGPAYFMGAASVASVAGLATTVTLAGITDGTSNTVIWSEFVRGRTGPRSRARTRSTSCPPLPSTNAYVPLTPT